MPPDDEIDEPDLSEDYNPEALEDIESDRIFNDDFDLVGRKLKALYTNGWFVGNIIYFNTVLKEYKVEFEDGTSDYIEPSDIDNVEIILIDITCEDDVHS